MNNELTIFDEILFKGLQPWLPENNPDKKFAPMLSEIKIGVPQQNMIYEVDFLRPFNNKTKYYFRLIMNEMNVYCDLVINLISDSEDIRIEKYWLNDILDKKLKSRITEIGKLIKEKQLDLSSIDPKKGTFNMDENHKTDTYIIQLLKTCLIKIFLEIQEKFKNLRDDILVVEDFYSQLLFETIPANTFIKENQPVIPIIIKTPFEAENSHQITSKSFTYKELSKNSENLNNLCDSLKKFHFISEKTSVTNFKKIFSGKEISQPVVWTGNISELHYFIKLIHNINQSVENLKQKHWEVACICFVQKDGSQFDRAKLKEQKKPQSTASLLEQSAAHL